MIGKGIQQLQNVISRQQLLTEAVKSFQFAAPTDRFFRLFPCPIRQLAGDSGSGEKSQQSNPVLRARNGECVDGRQKVIVECRRLR